LRRGIYTTDIDETIETAAKPRATYEDTLKKWMDLAGFRRGEKVEGEVEDEDKEENEDED
jgi:hypothetical protein